MTTITIPNTFVPATTISSTEMNANFQAVADAIEDSVALDGTTPMTGQLRLVNGTAALPAMTFDADPNMGIYRFGADDLGFSTNGTARAHIDSAGKVVLGTAAAQVGLFSETAKLQLLGADGPGAQGIIARYSADASGAGLQFLKSRNATAGSHTVVQSGDGAGTLSWGASDGDQFIELASISGLVDGTPGNNDMPGRLVFSTTPDGSATPTERGRVTASGWVQANAMGAVTTGVLSAVATQVFTGSDTYTPTTNMKYCRVRIQAPGGGGGGADGVGDAGGTNGVNGGGGGGGEYAEGWFTAAQIGASQTVTIGAVGAAGSTTGGNGGTGGTTSLGALLTAIGGSGGTGSGSDSTSSASRTGGAGGTGGTGGFFRQRGGAGGRGMAQRAITVQLTWGGSQGGSVMAPTGATPNAQGGSATGTTGLDYGQGGQGGFVQSTTGVAGGAGGASIMLIEEFG